MFRHNQTFDLDGIPLRLSVNRRARRVSIRIDAKGQAVAVAPSERRLVDAVAFARSKHQWIAERLAARPAGDGYKPGGTVPLEGVPVRLEQMAGASAARLVDTPGGMAIRSGGQGDAFARRIENLLKRMARERLAHHTGVHARTLGLKAPKVGIGDPKSRWGSCTPGRGSIRYSWRLILAPPEVLDYVAAHEVAHLVQADHSPAFWAVVERLIGDHRPHRAWLRAHGAGLHAVGRS
ncbi:M48 family metallopeptidase [Brevundimonas aveniformis]|uniref:M48 family metallopeptidase n=1 Tax=Brevundimonas aveniformis TaxID=370977 RepID=UPI0003F8E43B|nr:SprT family zinc-dependent metalloprotease [Brevundimonas aveniformis]